MTPENASILADFINNCIRENNIAINTRIAYIKNISHLERFLNHKAFNDMTQQDILSFLESHRKSEAADPLHKWVGTYNLILAILLRFFKWLYQPQINHKERRTPPILENIKMLKRKEKTVYQARDMWTSFDDGIFLKYCQDKRLKCYHAMSRDTSGRPHELLKLRIGDIIIKSAGPAIYAEATIGKGGKTNQRTVPLINSLPYYKDWQENHPHGANRNAFLFPSFAKESIYRNRPLKASSLLNLYTELKKKFFPRLLLSPDVPPEDKQKIKDLLNKPWNPYIRRHSALTEKAKLINEYSLRLHAGWSKTSRMVEIYTHELGNESCELLLQAYGIKSKDTEGDNILKPKQCSNCMEPNKPDSKFCTKCRMVLTYDAYNETLQKEQEKETDLFNLRQTYEEEMKNIREEVKIEMKNQIAELMARLKPEIVKDGLCP